MDIELRFRFVWFQSNFDFCSSAKTSKLFWWLCGRGSYPALSFINSFIHSCTHVATITENIYEGQGLFFRLLKLEETDFCCHISLECPYISAFHSVLRDYYKQIFAVIIIIKVAAISMLKLTFKTTCLEWKSRILLKLNLLAHNWTSKWGFKEQK